MSTLEASAVGAARSIGQRSAILICAILQVALPSLPAIGVGQPIGERSDNVDTLITPAGWAFSIWGPLFAGSLIYAVYQLLPSQRHNRLLAKIGWASAGAFFGNALWALYTQSFGLSVISALIIIFTLICLLSVFRDFVELGRPFTRGEQFLVVLPLSALASWLTAATIVNVAAALTYHGVELDNVRTIAAGVVHAGGIIAAATVWYGRGNPWYALVFLWALAGIYGSAQSGIEVEWAAVASAALVILSALLRLARESDRNHWLRAPA